MNAQALSEILTIQYRYNTYVFGANLKDLSDEQGLARPHRANNLNWVAGHIAQARGGTLRLLGQDSSFAADKYDRYVRGSAPIASADSAVPLHEIIADMAATEPALQAGLAALTDEMLAGKAPFSPNNDPAETVGSLLAGLVFHEAYHAGQLGVLRRLAGSEGAIP